MTTMTTNQERKCPDCAALMHPIRLIDKSQANTHNDLEYTLPESKRGFWLAQFPIEGKVRAYMCEQCGRILLYGEPNKA